MYINMYVNTIIKWYSSPEAIYIHAYTVMILFAVLLKISKHHNCVLYSTSIYKLGGTQKPQNYTINPDE